MTIKQFIEKSIKGGFRWEEKREGHQEKIVVLNNYWFEYHDTYKIPVAVGDFTNIIKLNTHWLFLRPDFWRCAGKEMGWDDKTKLKKGYSTFKQSTGEDYWKYQWHRFIDHLAEDKSIESFFESL